MQVNEAKKKMQDRIADAAERRSAMLDHKRETALYSSTPRAGAVEQKDYNELVQDVDVR